MTTLTKTKPWNRRQLSDFKRAVIAHLWAETYFNDHIRAWYANDWENRWQEMVANGQAKSVGEAEAMTEVEYEEEEKWQNDNWFGVWEEKTTLESVVESINQLRKYWADKPLPAGQSAEDKKMPFPVEEHLEEKRGTP